MTFDLDAAAAARAETRGAPFRFTWRGSEYEVPNQALWPLAAQAALGEGDLLAALRGILGDEQMDRFAATRPTLSDVTALLDALAKDSGTGADSGE